MVTKNFCDRCGKEIKVTKKKELIQEVFENFFEEENNVAALDEVSFCSKCKKGYNKIIKETNKKIKEYLNYKN